MKVLVTGATGFLGDVRAEHADQDAEQEDARQDQECADLAHGKGPGSASQARSVSAGAGPGSTSDGSGS